MHPPYVLCVTVDNAVNETVLAGLSGTHEIVALGVAADFLEGASRVGCQNVVEIVSCAKDVLCVDLDV